MLFKLMATLTSFAIAAGSALIFGPSPHMPKVGAKATVHVPKPAPSKVASLMSLVGGGQAFAQARNPRMIECTTTTQNGQKRTVIVMTVYRKSDGSYDPWTQDPLTL